MMNQLITFEEYVKALSEDSVMPKPKLEKILKDREEVKQRIQQMQIQANALQGAMEEAMIMQEQNENQIQQMVNQAQGINDNVMAMRKFK